MIPFYVFYALGAFLLSLIGTRLIIVTLRKRTQPVNVAVMTNKRPPAVPGGGGFAIVFALIISLLSTDISYGLILAILLLAAVSLLHNLIDIPLPIRLLVQAMAVIIPMSTAPIGLFEAFLPETLDKIATGIVWIWFINVFASMDRADGLCAIEGTSIATGLCLIAVFAGNFPSVLSIYSLITACALVGFLWWNWPPAKIHMGEVGTAPVAFLLGYLLLVAANEGYHYTALILPAYLLTDGLATHLLRIFKARKLDTPYYYQMAFTNGRSHAGIVRYIIGINILLTFLALSCVVSPENTAIYVASAYLCVFIVLGFFAHKLHTDSGNAG